MLKPLSGHVTALGDEPHDLTNVNQAFHLLGDSYDVLLDTNVPESRRIIASVISLCHCRVESKKGKILNVRDWEAIAKNLSQAGFSWGCSSETDSAGRVIFTAEAYSRDGRRFIVLADERLTAFLELERAIGVDSQLVLF